MKNKIASTPRLVWKILLPREKKILVILIFIGVINAIFQSIGVASILPFISVLSDTTKIHQGWLGIAYEHLNDPGERTFIVYLGVLSLALFIGGNIFHFLFMLANARFCAGRLVTLSQRLLDGYLRRPYDYYLSVRSADVIQNLVTHLQSFVDTCISQTLNFVSALIVVVGLFVVMIIPEPQAAIVLGIFFGGGYGLIIYAIRKKLYVLGKTTRNAYNARHKWVSEIIGGVKELIVLNRFAVFSRRFNQPLQDMYKASLQEYLWASLPTIVMQTFAFSVMMGMMLLYVALRGDFKEMVPLMALYGACTYKILPAVTSLFKSVAKIQANRFVAELIWELLPENIDGLRVLENKVESIADAQGKPASIKGENIIYRYPTGERAVLDGLSFCIQSGEFVALVGGTGAGKTTLMDVILGLLEIQTGQIAIDTQYLNKKNVSSWRSRVGYVPQHVYLSDDTILRNIAFGVADYEVDYHKVREATACAQIANFIERELPLAYDTVVGERGIRLSGGQRQRLGIARALYHDPSVLVLDEATSALDVLTESAVLKTLKQRAGGKTIIMVTHRLSTVQQCDKIFMLCGGKIVGSGSFQDLKESCPEFRELTQAMEN